MHEKPSQAKTRQDKKRQGNRGGVGSAPTETIFVEEVIKRVLVDAPVDGLLVGGVRSEARPDARAPPAVARAADCHAPNHGEVAGEHHEREQRDRRVEIDSAKNQPKRAINLAESKNFCPSAAKTRNVERGKHHAGDQVATFRD